MALGPPIRRPARWRCGLGFGSLRSRRCGSYAAAPMRPAGERRGDGLDQALVARKGACRGPGAAMHRAALAHKHEPSLRRRRFTRLREMEVPSSVIGFVGASRRKCRSHKRVRGTVADHHPGGAAPLVQMYVLT